MDCIAEKNGVMEPPLEDGQERHGVHARGLTH